jgi:SAM-dependent methyltransferase
MDNSGRSIEDYAKKYIEECAKDISFEAVLSDMRKNQILASLDKYKHNNILEIGCGLNPVFQYCHDFITYTVLEPSDIFAKRAEEMARLQKANINIVHNFGEKAHVVFSDTSQKFDFVILSNVLHEVPDPEILLKSIYDICGPQTVVHVDVPNVYSFHRLLALEMGLIGSIFEKSEMETRFQRNTQFVKESLYKIVEKQGFEVLSFASYFIKPFTNRQMESIIGQNIVSRDVIQGLERMSKYLPDFGSQMYVDVKRKDR